MRTAILLLFLPSALLAQSSSLLTPAGGSLLGIELLHPFFQDNYDRYMTSGGAIISGRFGGSSASFLVDVPFYRGPTGGLLEEYSSGIGNPYLGVEFSKQGSDASFELGTRVALYREKQDRRFFMLE